MVYGWRPCHGGGSNILTKLTKNKPKYKITNDIFNLNGLWCLVKIHRCLHNIIKGGTVDGISSDPQFKEDMSDSQL